MEENASSPTFELSVTMPGHSPRFLKVKDSFFIGLDPRNDLILVHDKMAPKQLEFKVIQKDLVVKNWGHSDLVYLNDLPLQRNESVLLDENDAITLDNVSIHFQKIPDIVKADPLPLKKEKRQFNFAPPEVIEKNSPKKVSPIFSLDHFKKIPWPHLPNVKWSFLLGLFFDLCLVFYLRETYFEWSLNLFESFLLIEAIFWGLFKNSLGGQLLTHLLFKKFLYPFVIVFFILTPWAQEQSLIELNQIKLPTENFIDIHAVPWQGQSKSEGLIFNSLISQPYDLQIVNQELLFKKLHTPFEIRLKFDGKIASKNPLELKHQLEKEFTLKDIFYKKKLKKLIFHPEKNGQQFTEIIFQNKNHPVSSFYNQKIGIIVIWGKKSFYLFHYDRPKNGDINLAFHQNFLANIKSTLVKTTSFNHKSLPFFESIDSLTSTELL